MLYKKAKIEHGFTTLLAEIYFVEEVVERYQQKAGAQQLRLSERLSKEKKNRVTYNSEGTRVAFGVRLFLHVYVAEVCGLEKDDGKGDRAARQERPAAEPGYKAVYPAGQRRGRVYDLRYRARAMAHLFPQQNISELGVRHGRKVQQQRQGHEHHEAEKGQQAVWVVYAGNSVTKRRRAFNCRN